MDIDMVKSTMAEHGMTSSVWGGDIDFIPVSALNGDGIEELRETINVQAELMELQAGATSL